MALIKTVKELLFDMMFEEMSSMDLLVYYNDAAKKHKLPEVKLNLYKNIKADIDEDMYCKEDPLIVVKDGKTISLTYLDFVSKYLPEALPFILRDYNIYEEYDEPTYEEFVNRIVSKSKKFQEYDKEILTAFIFDEDRNITMHGCITTDILLQQLIECDENGEIEEFRDNYTEDYSY